MSSWFNSFAIQPGKATTNKQLHFGMEIPAWPGRGKMCVRTACKNSKTYWQFACVFSAPLGHAVNLYKPNMWLANTPKLFDSLCAKNSVNDRESDCRGSLYVAIPPFMAPVALNPSWVYIDVIWCSWFEMPNQIVLELPKHMLTVLWIHSAKESVYGSSTGHSECDLGTLQDFCCADTCTRTSMQLSTIE